MKYRFASVSVFLLCLLLGSCLTCECPPCRCPTCECPAEGAAAEAPDSMRWFVKHVTDGDTLKASLEFAGMERLETVRLLNIDTPEKNEPGFVEATEALKTIVRGGYIELDYETPGVEKRDGFGRLLAYVVVGELNANVELVRQGWSKFYTKYGKGRLREDFMAAEGEARANRRGLWRLGG